MKLRFEWRLAALIGLVLSGCTALSVSAPTTTPSPTSRPISETMHTATPTVTPEAGLITLTLWAPEFLAPYDETGAATFLADEVRAFTQRNPDIQVDILVKKASGPGGMVDLLRTASKAAPTVLPDLVLLNEDALRTTIAEALVQPVLPVAETDFYPFVVAATQVVSPVYAVPLFVELEHMVYNPFISLTPPLSWTAVLSGGYSLLFPAAPVDALAGDTLLAAYLSAGGSVLDEEGNPFLERAQLESLYSFLEQLIARGLLDSEQVTALPDAAACWEAYQQGWGYLSAVPAGPYWATPDRSGIPTWGLTWEATPVAIGHIWSFVVVTDVPVRQEAAWQLLQWLSMPERRAGLATAAVMLPPDPAALAQWSLAAEDYDFLDTLLRATEPALPVTIDIPVRQALQAGLTMLLEGAATPEQAATHALTVLRE